LNVIKAKQASNRRATLALRRGITGNNKPVNNVRSNKPVNNVRSNLTANFSKLGNMKMNISKGAPRPKMESFNLFLNSPNVNNETVNGLLKKITLNKGSFIGTNKNTIRNVLNKIIRRNNQPQNLSMKAGSLKNTMFPNNVRQLRNRP
jgi:inosine-uridine nucleoside N-ribohydrolase